MGFFENIVRYLFYIIDSLVFWINTILFEIFTLISKTTFVSNLFDVFFNRVYVILGIFILFRIAFAMIQMVINPDLINDKQKSPGKLAMRTVVSLMLIIAVPSIFTFAYELQNAVIDENILGKIILGPSDSVNDDSVLKSGKMMAWKVYRGFVNIDNHFIDEKATEESETLTLNSDVSSEVKNCLRNLNDADRSKDPFDTLNKDGCLNAKEDDIYIYDYKWIVSTIATGMVAWILIGFCLDVGVRVIKLGFLQLIAPIPISSYMLGDKDSAFNNWVKASIMCYLEVFIRLIIIYFIIFIVSAIFNSSLNIPETSMVMKGLVKVVITLGLLVFAKEAPNLLKDMFGIKGDTSSFSLNPMNRLNSSPLAKMAIGGAVAGVAAGAGNIGKKIMSFNKDRQALVDNGSSGFGATARTLGGLFATGLGGMFGGAVAGGMAGFGKDAKIGSTINKGLMQANANRELRADRNSIGYGAGARFMDNLKGIAGVDSAAKAGANATRNRLEGLKQTRAAMAQRQYELQSNLNPELLSKIAAGGYTYNAFEKSWYNSSGNKIDDIYSNLGITDVSGYDFTPLTEVSMPVEVNRDDFTTTSSLMDASGNPIESFDEAAYNQAMADYNNQMAEYQSYLTQKEEYDRMLSAKNESDYLKTIEEISGLDKDIISTQKELGKWEKEQNRVERKNPGNK